jgi:SNF2 family DNA or RNA helicase
MITIKTVNHEITVKAPFSHAFNGTCKSIPGWDWDYDRRAWVYPATPIVAMEIADRFTGKRLCTDHEFDELVKRGRNGTRLPDGESILPPAIPPPDSKTDSWAHQIIGYANILTRPANLLAWDMRTGKTKGVIDAIVNLPDVNRVLIVCRKTIMHVWRAEFPKHAAHPVNVIILDEGTVVVRARKVQQAIQLHEARMDPEPLVFVVNYEAVSRAPLGTLILSTVWDMVVLDEIQRIKNARGRWSRYMGKLAMLAKRRVGLSGRPMPHSPEDIFGEFRFLDSTIFGKHITYFRHRYFIMGGYTVQERPTKVLGLKPEHAAEFQAKIASITHFVTLEEVLPDLPPVDHMTQLVELKPATRKIYRELFNDLVTRVEGGLVTAKNAMVKVMKLQQVAAGFLRIDREETRGEIVDTPIGDEKATALAELLDDLPPTEPVVVFCRFQHDLDVIADVAKKCDRIYFRLCGKQKELAAWQERTAVGGGGDVLIVQIQTGDEGVDFTRAAYCVLYSTGFISPGQYDQILARFRGINQIRPVTYIHLLAKETVDETAFKALQKGRDMLQAIIEGIRNESHA